MPQLLDMLDIEGCVVTSDAMGCQKSIVRKIVEEKKASYVLAVKDNHRNLHEQVLETAKMVRPTATFKEIDAGHGRVEERTYKIYRDLSFVTGIWNWPGLSALVVVESRRYDKPRTPLARIIESGVLETVEAERLLADERRHNSIELFVEVERRLNAFFHALTKDLKDQLSNT